MSYRTEFLTDAFSLSFSKLNSLIKPNSGHFLCLSSQENVRNEKKEKENIISYKLSLVSSLNETTASCLFAVTQFCNEGRKKTLI